MLRFRWDYLEDQKKPLTSFAYFKQHGTTIPFVTPVFPPEDFPVWTSMATGENQHFVWIKWIKCSWGAQIILALAC